MPVPDLCSTHVPCASSAPDPSAPEAHVPHQGQGLIRRTSPIRGSRAARSEPPSPPAAAFRRIPLPPPAAPASALSALSRSGGHGAGADTEQVLRGRGCTEHQAATCNLRRGICDNHIPLAVFRQPRKITAGGHVLPDRGDTEHQDANRLPPAPVPDTCPPDSERHLSPTGVAPTGVPQLGARPPPVLPPSAPRPPLVRTKPRRSPPAGSRRTRSPQASARGGYRAQVAAAARERPVPFSPAAGPDAARRL